jgi:hypothetical protein
MGTGRTWGGAGLVCVSPVTGSAAPHDGQKRCTLSAGTAWPQEGQRSWTASKASRFYAQWSPRRGLKSRALQACESEQTHLPGRLRHLVEHRAAAERWLGLTDPGALEVVPSVT